MKLLAWLKTLYHFLGSVHFAVTLIGVTVLFIAVGTFLESKTASHSYAALYTYRHPAFQALLALYFVNILFSALRRWPFKVSHVPFLLTHLGLLMILGGTLAKGIWGLQGIMAIEEGHFGQEILLPETIAVRIEKTDPTDADTLLVGHTDPLRPASPFSDVTLELLSFAPHSSEKYVAWIHSRSVAIAGLKPFPLGELRRLQLFPPPAPPWEVVAFRTDDPESFAQQFYLDRVDLLRQPALLMLQDNNFNTHLYAFDPWGRVWKGVYRGDNPGTVAVYDDGFGGYAAIAHIPFSEQLGGRETLEKQSLEALRQEDGTGITLESPLAVISRNEPPGQKLEDNCPRAIFKIKRDGIAETIALVYDRTGAGMRRPIFSGAYTLKLQPRQQLLPYRVHLVEARQINYANSNQPYSYESDLVITGLDGSARTAKTISMNNVFETWDGYRFYLASMMADENKRKRIVLAVNYDPAKYILTYPGAAVLSVGILLLFWGRRTLLKNGTCRRITKQD